MLWFILNFVAMRKIIFLIVFIPYFAFANSDSLALTKSLNSNSTTDSIFSEPFIENIEANSYS